ncbi:MAG: HNH endonuclease signature motif containing protein [Bacteroidota bacterium]
MKLVAYSKTPERSGKRRYWTQEEDRYLLKHYRDDDTKEICRVLNRSKCGVYGRSYFLGLNKSEEGKRKYGCYLTGTEGTQYRFQKGHTPVNKGKPMSPEQYEKSKHTFFKKGQLPVNLQPVGTITVRSNHRRKRSYLYIKIAEPNKWLHLHRYIWEMEHGPIPKELNLVFKDGDFLNCQIDNLELITKAENMRRNTIHNRYPEELKQTIFTLAQLKRTINRHEKQD